MQTGRLQQNSKIQSSSNQQEQYLQKQQQQSSKQSILRDFLKENIENVKLKSLKLQKLKLTSSCPIEPIVPLNKPLLKTNMVYSYSAKGDAPRSVFERLAAGADNTRNTCKKRLSAGGVIMNDLKSNKPLSARKLGKQPQKQDDPGLDLVEKKIDQMVQTFDQLDDKFTEDAIIMEPTIFALKKIRDEREKLLQEQLKEKLLEKRKFGKDSAKLETHLNDLSEFIDTGSISRRKLTLELNKKRLKNVIYDRSFLKNLSAPSEKEKKDGTHSDGGKVNTNGEKVSKIPLRQENKVYNSPGDGPISRPNDDNVGALITQPMMAVQKLKIKFYEFYKKYKKCSIIYNNNINEI